MPITKKAEIPKEFRQMVLCADFAHDLEPGGDQVANMIGGLTNEQRATVKAFLTELLASNPGDAELRDIWKSSSDTTELRSGARQLFTQLRDRL